MEPMQLCRRGPRQPTPAVQLGPHGVRHAIHWWSFRLNQMFGYLCDPTTFTDEHGLSAPHEHYHWMLTFDQVFGLTTALQAAGRDRTNQRALMNSLLDVYADRILDRAFERLCTLEFARESAGKSGQKCPTTSLPS